MNNLLRGCGMALALGLTARAEAATHYVAKPPLGDDTHSGAAATPWATLQHAADQVVAGDTVNVAPGNYVGFHISKQGSELLPITFYGDGGAVINSVNSKGVDAVLVENSSYLTVDSFQIKNVSEGVNVTGGNHVVVQRNAISTTTGYSVHASASPDLALIANECTGGSGGGIFVGADSTAAVVRANRVHDIGANGISLTGGVGSLQGVTVEQNVVHAVGIGGQVQVAGIRFDGVQNSRIWNNLVYDVQTWGIALLPNGSTTSSNNLVMNNTVVLPSGGHWALLVFGSTGGIARNNVLLNRDAAGGSIDISADSLPFDSDYNVVKDQFLQAGATPVYYTLAEWRSAQGLDKHSILATEAELFVDAPTDKYSLLSTAPAIDKGTALNAPTFDLLGKARPVGVAFDIGAYEFSPGASGGSGNAGTGGTGNAGAGGTDNAGTGGTGNPGPGGAPDGVAGETGADPSGGGETSGGATASGEPGGAPSVVDGGGEAAIPSKGGSSTIGGSHSSSAAAGPDAEAGMGAFGAASSAGGSDSDGDGCGCRMARPDRPVGSLGLASVALALAFWRRRRRSVS